MSGSLSRGQAALRSFGLSLPDATEDFPWGERVLKVNDKVFVFLGKGDGDDVGLSVKLPVSREAALQIPGAKPTGYGLGKAGWVSLTFGPGDDFPQQTLEAFIEESWKAVAPKRVLKAWLAR